MHSVSSVCVSLALLWLLVMVLAPTTVLANTDIINFEAVESHHLALSWPDFWTVLNAEDPEWVLEVQPAPLYTPLTNVCEGPDWGDDLSGWDQCPHETWLILDLDSSGWESFSKFTLRISWPASSPTDFSIQTFTSESLLVHGKTAPGATFSTLLSTKGRQMFTRIRLVDTGVRPPSAEVPDTEPVKFMVILEPLYFGVLPASVAPILAFLVPLVAFASFVVVPFVNRHLSKIAEEARVALAVSDQKNE